MRYSTQYFVGCSAHGICLGCTGAWACVLFWVMIIASSDKTRCRHAFILPRVYDTNVVHKSLPCFRVHGCLVFLLWLSFCSCSLTNQRQGLGIALLLLQVQYCPRLVKSQNTKKKDSETNRDATFLAKVKLSVWKGSGGERHNDTNDVWHSGFVDTSTGDRSI